MLFRLALNYFIFSEREFFLQIRGYSKAQENQTDLRQVSFE